MRALILIIKTLNYTSERITGFLFRLQQFLAILLPALLPPVEMTRLIRAHYDRGYRETARQDPESSYQWTLESWEEDAFARQQATSGAVLVLGAGTGRESIALAKRGFRVVGLDISREALQIASLMAQKAGVTALFIQADFLCFPTRSLEFDYILLSGIMYSSIPGRAGRQAWLKSLVHHLKNGGCALLNFQVDRWPRTRSRRLAEWINRLAMRLPGANKACQRGDACAQGHFLHAFQSEGEIRDELVEAGVTIADFSWNKGFAMITFPPHDPVAGKPAL